MAARARSRMRAVIGARDLCRFSHDKTPPLRWLSEAREGPTQSMRWSRRGGRPLGRRRMSSVLRVGVTRDPPLSYIVRRNAKSLETEPARLHSRAPQNPPVRWTRPPG